MNVLTRWWQVRHSSYKVDGLQGSKACRRSMPFRVVFKLEIKREGNVGTKNTCRGRPPGPAHATRRTDRTGTKKPVQPAPQIVTSIE